MAEPPAKLSSQEPDAEGEPDDSLVSYKEYRSTRAPWTALGDLGDIYLDLRPISYALYAKLENGWVQWPGLEDTKPVMHPVHEGYRLGVNMRTRCYGWLECESYEDDYWPHVEFAHDAIFHVLEPPGVLYAPKFITGDKRRKGRRTAGPPTKRPKLAPAAWGQTSDDSDSEDDFYWTDGEEVDKEGNVVEAPLYPPASYVARPRRPPIGTTVTSATTDGRTIPNYASDTTLVPTPPRPRYLSPSPASPSPAPPTTKGKKGKAPKEPKPRGRPKAQPAKKKGGKKGPTKATGKGTAVPDTRPLDPGPSRQTAPPPSDGNSSRSNTPDPSPFDDGSGSIAGTSESGERQGFFTRADVTFHPIHSRFPTPCAPLHGHEIHTVILIHPPFTKYPGCISHAQPLTYTELVEHPDWVLDAQDFVWPGNPNPNAVHYPASLEPPRGRLIKDSRLRCTFCIRSYAGVNAKSMWRRHVFDYHGIAMTNRRDGGGRPRQHPPNHAPRDPQTGLRLATSQQSGSPFTITVPPPSRTTQLPPRSLTETASAPVASTSTQTTPVEDSVQRQPSPSPQPVAESSSMAIARDVNGRRLEPDPPFPPGPSPPTAFPALALSPEIQALLMSKLGLHPNLSRPSTERPEAYRPRTPNPRPAPGETSTSTLASFNANGEMQRVAEEALQNAALNLQNSNLRNAHLFRASLSNINPSNATPPSTIPPSATPPSATPLSANLQSDNLQSANLQSDNLQSADLQSDNQQSADLQSTDLRSAGLQNASLPRFDMPNAVPRATSPQNADLQNATSQDIAAQDTTAQNTAAQNASSQDVIMRNAAAQNDTAQNDAAQNDAAQDTSPLSVSRAEITTPFTPRSAPSIGPLPSYLPPAPTPRGLPQPSSSASPHQYGMPSFGSAINGTVVGTNRSGSASNLNYLNPGRYPLSGTTPSFSTSAVTFTGFRSSTPSFSTAASTFGGLSFTGGASSFSGGASGLNGGTSGLSNEPNGGASGFRNTGSFMSSINGTFTGLPMDTSFLPPNFQARFTSMPPRSLTQMADLREANANGASPNGHRDPNDEACQCFIPTQSCGLCRMRRLSTTGAYRS